MSELQLPTQILMARQPILDTRLKLFAYELLFRKDDPHSADFLDGDCATSQVILNAITGITENTGKTVPVFINMTESMLLTGRAPLLPTDSIVLEVLETVTPTPELIANLTGLVKAGYRLALDDFVYDDSWLPVIALAQVVKIDIRVHDREGLARQVELLKPFPVRLLAEKIETHAELEYCRSLGFTLFQGYFLERPEIVHGKKVSANLQLVMTILSTLQKDNVSTSEISRLVQQDARLSYQLLRIINSAAYARPRAVQSVQDAVNLLGITALRNWVSLIAMANAHTKPSELMNTLLVRAKTCENVARVELPGDIDAAFTTGLFSGLDALLDSPLDVLLTQLPLSADIKAALSTRGGPLGNLLQRVIAYEHGDWEALEATQAPQKVLCNAYLSSLIWARKTQAVLAGP